MKEFNINSYVGIKLTKTGIAILKRNHEDLLKAYADNPEVLKLLGPFQVPEVDDNGYTYMQLWQVMTTFGKYMYNGNPNLPFRVIIQIADENLKDPVKHKQPK